MGASDRKRQTNHVSHSQRIYLDHAATSWPKSAEVLDAVDDYARNTGAAAGRGAYGSASIAARQIQSARRSIATLIGAESADCISLHSSGTTALNAAIFGIVSAGDHVITTAADHNSVLRPLQHLHTTANVDVTIVPCDQYGRVAADAVLAELRPTTRLVIVSHASNVTGAVAPVQEIGDALASTPTHFAVDAAQTLGYIGVDIAQIKCDLLASPGHKGIGGPLGTGFLYVAPSLHNAMRPNVFGGTGSHSESLDMPTAYPQKMEAGNLNVPAIAGLAVAAAMMCQNDLPKRAARLSELSAALHQGLGAIDSLTLHSQPGPLAIASLSTPLLAAGDLSAILDAEFGIEVRSGFHCAAMIQQYLTASDGGTLSGGTLRISAGPDTSDEIIEMTIDAIRQIAAA